MLDAIKIETERLVLREFVEADWSFVHRWASDLEVVRYMTWGPNDEKQTRDFVSKILGWQQAAPRLVFNFAVETKDRHELIGSCGMHIARTLSEGSSQSIAQGGGHGFDDLSGVYTSGLNAAVGYCYSRQAWGRGYASEAARAVLRFGFETLKLHKIFATCDAENIGSARVLEKIGMKREAYLKEDIKIKGRWRDSLLYAILEREF